ncbi:hypothetical protein AB0M44_30980 [Streptosporangium subroseum]|uniref:hypothetical protein n=1 Tax=Streptosporangium subroseum TaxID=106412 RepID=UPI0034271E18
MNARERLVRDLDRLNRMDSAEILQETGLAEVAEARGQESDDDRKYRAALEKRAR